MLHPCPNLSYQDIQLHGGGVGAGRFVQPVLADRQVPLCRQGLGLTQPVADGAVQPQGGGVGAGCFVQPCLADRQVPLRLQGGRLPQPVLGLDEQL